ncbi:MAG: hypothetical protein LBP78_04860, partial [Acidaminococcales bacterium]|nr:hypothetical protein [Acidaminococcales bacterium]
PELIVCLLEDAAAVAGLLIAFAGVLLTRLTGSPLFDAIASGAIGVLLICISITLGVQTKSLLIGESADEQIVAAISRAFAGRGIKSVISNKTVHLSADSLLSAIKVELEPDLSAKESAEAINAAEKRVRALLPEFKIAVYAEPDLRKGAPPRA